MLIQSTNNCLHRGTGKGGQGGHVPSEIATLNSMKYVTFNKIFSIFFVFWGLRPRPQDLADDVTHSFVPSKTNSWLRTCVYRHRYRHNVITTQT